MTPRQINKQAEKLYKEGNTPSEKGLMPGDRVRVSSVGGGSGFGMELPKDTRLERLKKGEKVDLCQRSSV